MPVVTVISLVAATLSMAIAMGQLAIARAPGWRVARLFAAIAGTAGLYSAGNVIFMVAGLPLGVYEMAGRAQYVWASLHLVAWLPFAYGSETLSFRDVPRPARWWAWTSLFFAALFALTGWHLTGPLRHLTIEWAGVTYQLLSTTPSGDAYGAFLAAGMAFPFVQFFRRMRAGEPGMRLVFAGYSVFLVSCIIEALVASQVVNTVSPADIGFLAAVVPASILMVRRFVDEATQLRVLTGQLRGEVRDRTDERDRAQGALVESERHASLGRLAAGVGHEINNPLAYIRLALERMGNDFSHSGAPAQVWESIGQAHDGINRIQKVVEGLRTYSHRLDDRSVQDPCEIVRAAMKVAHPNLRHVAKLDADLAEAPPVMGDEPRLVQALVNLLVNAAQAVAERDGAGHVHVKTGKDERGNAFIEVADDGPGINGADIEKLGEPYFTTRGPGGGLGLGLFVTRGILDAHGGSLTFDAVIGKGTRVRMVLPAYAGVRDEKPAVSEHGDSGETPVTPAPGAPLPRILIVDDEPLVVRLLGKALEKEWAVTTAADGAEALLHIQREAFDVVLCDLMMPVISGMGLAEEVARRDPVLRERMVFMTGGAVTPAAEQFVTKEKGIFVAKPLDMRSLLRLLRETRQKHPVSPD